MEKNDTDLADDGASRLRDFIHNYLAQVLAGLTLVVLIGGGTYVVAELSALNHKVDAVSNQLEDAVYGFTFASNAIRELHAGQPGSADVIDRLDDRLFDLHQRVRQASYSSGNGYGGSGGPGSVVDELHWPKPIDNPSKLHIARSKTHQNAWAINLVNVSGGMSDVVSVLKGKISRVEQVTRFHLSAEETYWEVEIEGDEDVLTVWRLSEVVVAEGDAVPVEGIIRPYTE